MMSSVGFGRRGCFDLKPACVAAIFLSSALAGCSADITRFDSASFNLNDPPQATAALPRPSAPVRGGSDYDNPVTRSQRPGPYGAGAKPGGIDVAALPDATPPPAAVPPPAQPMNPPALGAGAPTTAMNLPRRKLYHPAAAPMTPVPVAKGEMIEVQQGDTLYGLSRRHQVSLAELMSVNGMTSPNLKPGQKLYLPAGRGAGAAAAAPAASFTPSGVPLPSANPAAQISPPSADLAAKYNGTYVMKPGDSLYQVARMHKVPYGELQQANAIANPLKVRAGTTLKVPAGYTMTAAAEPAAGVPSSTSAISAAPAAPAAPAPEAAAPSVPPTSAQPTLLNGSRTAPGEVPPKEDKVAVVVPQASAAAASEGTKLRWPAQGKIIAGFGGRPDGTHNDGINLSVPQGTEVHAAESGVIAYAGSELKGYGNLVLVRHDNGWVTAYAHNDELLVKRGDKVKRGQVIAKAGKTGTVDQPQVHFELRQGSKPVDPTPFMEKL